MHPSRRSAVILNHRFLAATWVIAAVTLLKQTKGIRLRDESICTERHCLPDILFPARKQSSRVAVLGETLSDVSTEFRVNLAFLGLRVSRYRKGSRRRAYGPQRTSSSPYCRHVCLGSPCRSCARLPKNASSPGKNDCDRWFLILVGRNAHFRLPYKDLAAKTFDVTIMDAGNSTSYAIFHGIAYCCLASRPNARGPCV